MMLLSWKWLAFLRHASLSQDLWKVCYFQWEVFFFCFFKSTDTTTVLGPLPRLMLWELGAFIQG